MIRSADQTSTHFEALTEQRCRELLAGVRHRHVAWNAPDGPQLLPVSYAD